MKSQHQGQYWIGGYETHGDKPQGTLTSVPFKVTHPWASFLVGGGPQPDHLRRAGPQGHRRGLLRAPPASKRRTCAASPSICGRIMGKEIFIRLVDKHSGGWGHINFDDFRFHADKPNVPPRKSAGAAAGRLQVRRPAAGEGGRR